MPWTGVRLDRQLRKEAPNGIKPGMNIAIKVPLYKWEETVAFYRNKLL